MKELGPGLREALAGVHEMRAGELRELPPLVAPSYLPLLSHSTNPLSSYQSFSLLDPLNTVPVINKSLLFSFPISLLHKETC